MTFTIATRIKEINDKSFQQFDVIYLDLGSNLGHRVQKRIQMHLSLLESTKIIDFSNLPQRLSTTSTKSSFSISSISKRSVASESCLILSLGNTNLSLEMLPIEELRKLPPESFHLHVTRSHPYNKTCPLALVSNGLPLDYTRHTNASFNKNFIHYGALVGAYASLELLGYAFLHPLEPYFPGMTRLDNCSISNCEIDIIESPYWPERGFHIHTQHPLEVTEVLQGHDIPQFGPFGPNCGIYNRRNKDHSINQNKDSIKLYCERWDDMVDDVNRLFEWAVANRLNKLEWLALGNFKWGNELETKMKRFRVLTNLAHEYSLLLGLDCPIVNQQQHSWSIVNPRSSLPVQLKSIRERIDWVFRSGFDFITTESGLSEFTHPECSLMLELMNEFANYANGTWGREAAIKVHCSTGQTCGEPYLDPITGDPINFNFLTMFATSKLGIFPHTIQLYSLDDPSAGAYGNENFQYIEDYLVYEGKKGNRSVQYYGETAYWVNVDVDVPLFLPIYGHRRQYDLQHIAYREISENFRIDGQMNFDSGWEWGYWLSDVITARASWNPFHILSKDNYILDRNIPISIDEAKSISWNVYSSFLRVFTNIFDDKTGEKLNMFLVNLTKSQEKLLIFGQVGNQTCPDIHKLSGFPYLSGDDTWIDLPRMFGMSILQADKVRMKEFDDPKWNYTMALLKEMDETFSFHASEIRKLFQEFQQNTCLSNQCKSSSSIILRYFKEIDDCVHILAMRAKHVRILYESMDPNLAPLVSDKAKLQRQSRAIIQDATEIVSRRESDYRVPWQRIAAWRENPTVYRYGYLWSVHSLYYWWRDQGLAEGGSIQSEHSPCYLNRMDASEIAVGFGKYTMEVIKSIINYIAPLFSGYPLEIINCFAAPTREYEFPRDLYPM